MLGHYLAGPTPYYIGYASALQLLSLNTQPVLDEQIVVARQIKPSVLYVKDVPFRFIYHNPAHFFGFAKTWVDGQHRVNCSDLEKTLIDCLFKPQYAGGITEIAKAIYKSGTTIDQTRLFEYVVQFGSQSVIKRLGFYWKPWNLERKFCLSFTLYAPHRSLRSILLFRQRGKSPVGGCCCKIWILHQSPVLFSLEL